MAYSVAQHLSLDVAEYDRTIRTLIPGYEEMLACAAGAVAAVHPKRVLDLGAGTAALSEQVLERTQDAVVELWDIDPAMLDQAEARVERFGKRVVRRLRSYHDPFPPCDVITGSLALHHIPTMLAKTELYGRAFAALRSGGALVIADATMPADAEGRRAGFQSWAHHMVEHGIEEARAFEHFDTWSSEDTYFPVDVEVEALESVGFEVRVPWQMTPSTVIVASRGEPNSI